MTWLRAWSTAVPRQWRESYPGSAPSAWVPKHEIPSQMSSLLRSQCLCKIPVGTPSRSETLGVSCFWWPPRSGLWTEFVQQGKVSVRNKIITIITIIIILLSITDNCLEYLGKIVVQTVIWQLKSKLKNCWPKINSWKTSNYTQRMK